MNSRLVTVQPSARSAAVADSTIGIGWFATVAIPLQPAALSGACAMCGELSLFSAAKVLLEDSRRILIEGARHRHRPSAALLAYDAGGTRHPRAGSDRQVLDIDIHLAVDTPWRCSPSFAEWSALRLQCIGSTIWTGCARWRANRKASSYARSSTITEQPCGFLEGR